MTTATAFLHEVNQRQTGGIVYRDSSGTTINLTPNGGYLPIGNGVISRIILKRTFPPIVRNVEYYPHSYMPQRVTEPWTNVIDARRNRILRNVYHVGDDYSPSATDEIAGDWLPHVNTGRTKPARNRAYFPSTQAYREHLRKIHILTAIQQLRRDLRNANANNERD